MIRLAVRVSRADAETVLAESGLLLLEARVDRGRDRVGDRPAGGLRERERRDRMSEVRLLAPTRLVELEIDGKGVGEVRPPEAATAETPRAAPA